MNTGEWTSAFLDWLGSEDCAWTSVQRCVVLAAIQFGNGSGQIRPGHPRLAEIAGCSERTVRRALNLVEETGWLTYVGGGHRGLAVTYIRSYPKGDHG